MNTDLMTIEEKKKLGMEFPYPHTSNIGLVKYINRFEGEITGIEIGTSCGESTHNFLASCPNIKKLYTIDPYQEFEDWIGTITQETVDKQREIAQSNLEQFGDRVEMIRSTSKDALERFENMQFDFIFVDGDHSFDGVLLDCRLYYPLLKKKGLFCGHDYGHLAAVTNAINTFRQEQNIPSMIMNVENTAFFWYK